MIYCQLSSNYLKATGFNLNFLVNFGNQVFKSNFCFLLNNNKLITGLTLQLPLTSHYCFQKKTNSERWQYNNKCHHCKYSL